MFLVLFRVVVFAQNKKVVVKFTRMGRYKYLRLRVVVINKNKCFVIHTTFSSTYTVFISRKNRSLFTSFHNAAEKKRSSFRASIDLSKSRLQIRTHVNLIFENHMKENIRAYSFLSWQITIQTSIPITFNGFNRRETKSQFTESQQLLVATNTNCHATVIIHHHYHCQNPIFTFQYGSYSAFCIQVLPVVL